MDSLEIETLARSILLIRPEDLEIRVVRAWWYYKRDEYGKAYDDFAMLYARNPLGKSYAYGFVSVLTKLKRFDEAAEVASVNKRFDERLVAFEIDIYRERAKLAYENRRYEEAEVYFGKVHESEPDDEDINTLLESSRYRKTFVARALAPIAGLSGHTYGSMTHDNKGSSGTGVSVLINQGVDWIKLPWDVMLRTYGEIYYRTRSNDFTYYDLVGKSVGIELDKSIFKLGVEYVSEQYTTQSKSDSGSHLFLGWYHDWYKYMFK